MMLTWTPDFCPSNPPCRLEIERDWSAVKSVLRYCAHHQSLRDGGLDDQQLFNAILQSSRVKETARWQIKLELGLDKEYPGVPYRVNPDGSFTIPTDRASLAWSLQDGSPGPLPSINTADRVRARAAANNAVAAVSRPNGTSTVTVE